MQSLSILLTFRLLVLSCSSTEGTQECHPCHRECDGVPMTCEYSFKLESYYSMRKSVCGRCPDVESDCFRKECVISAGVQRMLFTVNRQFPGPAIEVCQGDSVAITLKNQILSDEVTTIHWHGQTMLHNPYMDGVPFVNQCPIMTQHSITYRFNCSISGTHFWHSHEKVQRGDGMYGMFVVRNPPNSKKRQLYDEDLSEHMISIIDWSKVPLTESLIRVKLDNQPSNIDTILINGLGYLNASNPDMRFPIARFQVEPGKRYRFRFVNAAFYNCPVGVQIDKHEVTVIAADADRVQPHRTMMFNIFAGERYDIVVHANQKPGTYWMRFKGMELCAVQKIFQLALLEYTTSSSPWPQGLYPTFDTSLPQIPTGNQKGMTEVEVGIQDEKYYNLGAFVERLKALGPAKDAIDDCHVTKEYIKVGMPMRDVESEYGTSTKRIPMLNDIMSHAAVMPLLQYRHLFHNDQFCNAKSLSGKKNCSQENCSCLHVVKLPLHSLIEFIIYDEGDMNAHHPVHLHGFKFYVVARNRVGYPLTLEKLKLLDKAGLIERNLRDPIRKDVVVIPKGGYVVIRFITDNPGFWLFHCHVDVHANAGMRLVVKVGKNNDMPDPPEDFPECESHS